MGGRAAERPGGAARFVRPEMAHHAHSDAPLCDARAAPQVGGVAQGRPGRQAGVGETGGGLSEEEYGMASSDDEASPLATASPFDFSTLSRRQVDDPADGETLALFPEGGEHAGDRPRWTEARPCGGGGQAKGRRKGHDTTKSGSERMETGSPHRSIAPRPSPMMMAMVVAASSPSLLGRG